MRTATSNLIVLAAETADNKITGTAIDGDIKVLFAVNASEVNQQLFLHEANLVVSGKIRLGREICTIGMWITSVVAVVYLPVPAEVEAPAEIEAPATATKQKRASRSKKTKAVTELVCA
jgi:hypothetical protein